MGKRILSLLIVFTMMLCMMPVFQASAAAVAPSGTGTAGDPYLIASYDNLLWVSANNTANTGYSGKYFKQTADIDMSPTTSETWTPIGNTGTYFKGVYDGNGYSIKNLYISSATSARGVFGALGTAGTIKDLGVTNVNITCTANNSTTGSLVGASNGTILRCFSTGTVRGDGNTGGLVGYSDNGTIKDSFSRCTVIGNGASGTAWAQVGGLLGKLANPSGTSGHVVNSYATGNVTATHHDKVGGLIGELDPSEKVYSSFATGTTVTGATDVGYLTGLNEGDEYNVYVSADGNIDGTRTGTLTTYAKNLGSEFFKTESNFTDAAKWHASYQWDFTNTWAIDPAVNNGFPYLKNSQMAVSRAITTVYTNFSNATLNGFLHLGGDASLTGGVIRLTPASVTKAGSAFYNNKLKLAANRAFSSYFTFNLSSQGGGGADGFVFILNTSTNALGSSGQGMGYEGIDHSIGIEFDTYNNGTADNNSSNHIGVNLNGNMTTQSITEAPVNMKSGTKHVWVEYNGAKLEVRIADTSTRPAVATITYPINLATYLNTEDMYVGFTAATGGSYENHDITSWYFDGKYNPIEPALYAYTIAPTTVETTTSGNGVHKTINATIKDYTGAAVGAGETVSFNVISGDGTPSSATATTNASGVATATIDFNTTLNNTMRVSIGSGAYSDVAITFAPAPTLSVSGGSSAFTKGGGAVVVDSALTVAFGNSLDGAKVYITDGFVTGDTLSFTNQNGITGSYDATKGVLTLTGTATAADYQTALRSVAFNNTSSNLVKGTRIIGISLGAAVSYGGNGHYYEFVAAPAMTWTAAKAAAEARSLYGMQGYLATITSKGENDFIAKKTTGNGWLGLSDQGHDRQWYWVTGPEGAANAGAGTKIADQWALPNENGGYNAISGQYNNWASGEPNNYPNNKNDGENYGHMYPNSGTWNDFAVNNGSIKGYIVEYGGMPGDLSVALSGQKTLNVNLQNDNALLSNLITNRLAITPTYDIANLTGRYEISVANNIFTIQVTPTVSDAAATIKVTSSTGYNAAVASGNASGDINLNVGANTISVEVKAANGTTTKTYTLMAYRAASNNADLSNIGISQGTLSTAFDATTTSYTVDLAYNVSSIKLTPTKVDGAATIKVDGVSVTSGQATENISINPGETRNVAIVVTAEDGTTTKTYYVSLHRAASTNNKLSGLVLKTAPLNEAFAENTAAYTSTVENKVTSIRVVPTVADRLAKVTVNGTGVASGAESGDIALNVGANVITVKVTAQNGDENDYKITVTRKASNNADLLNLVSDTGRMSPAFDKTKTAYILVVGKETSSVSLTPTADDVNSTIKVNTADVTSGNQSGAITVNAGDVISVEVTAQDGTTKKTYSVRVMKEELITAKYPDFSADIGLLKLNNNAVIESNELVLTKNLTNQRGSAFYNNRVSLDNHRSFSSFFSFNLSGTGGMGQADGIVFTIQTVSNTAGSSGGGMGYQGLNPSIGIEFDTWVNTNVSDPAGPHIGFNVNGNIVSKQTVLTPFDIRNGSDCYTWVDYDGVSKKLEVRLANTDIRPAAATMTVNDVDLQSILNMDETYVGFTGATGGACQRQAIKSFYFNNDYSPINTENYLYSETPTTLNISASPNDNTSTSVITATVLDKLNHAVQGAIVNFSTDRGNLSDVQVITDANGQAQTTLTASVNSGAATVKAVTTGGAYNKVTITHLNITDAEAAANDAEALEIAYQSGDSSASVTRNVGLKTTGECGSTITWASDVVGVISNAGIVTRPDYFTGDKLVTLTATITNEGSTSQKVFKLNVRKLSYVAPVLNRTQSEISEAAVNDGSVTGTQTITITGGTFASDITAQDLIANNLPAGLGITLTRDSDTSVTIGFVGNAADHRAECSVQNVSVTIPKAKITGTLTDMTTANFAINFIDPARIYISEAEISEPAPYNTGALEGKLTVNIVNGSFASDISESELMVNNLPNDLGVTLTRVSGTQLTIEFTGNALLNENVDDVLDASITIFKDRLIGTDNNLTTNTFKINFNEQEPVMTVGVTEIRESDANDGSLTGTQTVTLAHGTFSNALSLADISVTGLPEGISLISLNPISNTQISFSFTGNALSHDEADSIANAKVQIFANKINPTNGAFEGIELPIASNGFVIKMISPPPSIVAQNAIINEAPAKDGSITDTQVIKLKDGTFTGVTATDVKVNNLPEGLGISVVQNDTTTLTVSFTGNAAAINKASENASITVSGSKITGSKSNLTTGTFNIACPTEATWAGLDKALLDIIYADGDNADSVTQDIGLTGIGAKDSVITWASDTPTTISNTGSVIRPTYTDGDKTVTLIATITNGLAAPVTKTFNLTVKKLPISDVEAYNLDLPDVAVGYEDGDSASYVTRDVYLKNIGDNGSIITWSSSKTNVISAAGVVTRASTDTNVTLIATITKGSQTTQKTFTMTVVSDTLGIGFAEGNSASSVKKNITLNQTQNASVAWSSSLPAIISNAGVVTRPAYGSADATVTLTATITDNQTHVVTTKIFTVIVKALTAQEETIRVAQKLSTDEAFSFTDTDNWESITSQFFALTTYEGATVSWSSGNTSIISIQQTGGNATATVNRPAGSDKNVILTADISIGGAHIYKTFLLVVQKSGTEKTVASTRTDTGRDAGGVTPGNVTANFDIMRTTLTNGGSETKTVDTIVLSDAGIQSLTAAINPSEVEALREVVLSMSIDAGAPADEYAVEIPATSVELLANKNALLSVVTPEASLKISSSELSQMAQSGLDLYFRIVPINSTAEQIVTQNAAQSAKQCVVLGIPREIETNYTSFATTVTLPLTGALASDASKIQVYIEHSDGSTEFVTPTIVYSGGQPAGVEFTITHFSRFQVVKTTAYSGNDSSTPTQVTETSKLIDLLVNDVNQKDTATATTVTKADGAVNQTIFVDNAKIIEKISSEKNGSVLTIPIVSATQNETVEMSGELVKLLEEKNDIIRFENSNAIYILPANQIKISGLYDKAVDLKNVKVRITISQASKSVTEQVLAEAIKKDAKLIGTPIDFKIVCSYNGKDTNISRFDRFVERLIPLSGQNQVTTGVYVNDAGKLSHVPTRIEEINGKSYAVISCLYNSLYALIERQTQFKDVETHWAKDIVDNSRSRMIVEGVGDNLFSPDKPITRAEFAAIITRALGLRCSDSTNPFSDVSKDAWYYDAVRCAVEYKLIKGYTDGTFMPNANITREEAFAIIARAAEIPQMDIELTNSEIGTLLGSYSDGKYVADWANENVAMCIKSEIVLGENGKINPKTSITRAEVSAIVIRFLKKAELI